MTKISGVVFSLERISETFSNLQKKATLQNFLQKSVATHRHNVLEWHNQDADMWAEISECGSQHAKCFWYRVVAHPPWLLCLQQTDIQEMQWSGSYNHWISACIAIRAQVFQKPDFKMYILLQFRNLIFTWRCDTLTHLGCHMTSCWQNIKVLESRATVDAGKVVKSSLQMKEAFMCHPK